MIACVLIPHVSAAVERRSCPARGRRPLIFTDRPWRGGVVAAVSAEAAQRGVHPDLPLRQAQALCPQAELLPIAAERDRAALEDLVELLSSFSARVEPGLWSEAPRRRRQAAMLPYPLAARQEGAAWCFVDLGVLRGMAPLAQAQELGRLVREQLGLAPALGLARGIFAAQLAAALAECDQALVIPPCAEDAFLAPLPLRLVVLEAELARRLRLLGIRTFGQLAELPEQAVPTQLGAQGAHLQRLARGADERPIPRRAPRPTEQVRRRLDGPLANHIALELLLEELTQELAARVQARGYAVRRLILSLALENGTILGRSAQLSQPASQADLLLRACSGLLAQARIDSGVEELAVLAEELVPLAGRQLELFAHGAGQARRLRPVLRDLIARYGPCFYRAMLLNPTARLPEQRAYIRGVEEM